MSTNSVSVYELLVRNDEIRGRRKHAPLDAIPDGKTFHDMFQVAHRFLKASAKFNTYLVNKGNRIVGVSDLTASAASRDIYCFIKQAAYGTKSEIISATTLKKSYDKLHDEGDAFAHFAFLRLPKGSARGLVLLHNIGNVGVKSWLQQCLEAKVLAGMRGSALLMRPLTSEEMLTKWMGDSHVTQMKVSYFEPADASDPASYLTDPSVEKTLILRKPNDDFGKLREFIGGGLKRKKVVAITDDNCSDASAVVLWNGRHRVVSLNSAKHPKAKFVLTEDDVTFNDGVPELDSFVTYAKKLADDIQAEWEKG